MGGSTSNTKDSAGRRLGIKRWGAAEVRKGEIIAKQRGYKWHAGTNVYGSKDHSIHSTVEGTVAWSRDRYAYKKRNRIHVVPRETPNRQFPTPPAFVYHPEMYPELAEMNPAPFNFVIPKAQKKRVRSPLKLSCSVVSAPSLEATGYANLSALITPEAFSQHKGFAHDLLDLAEQERLQDELHVRVNK